MYVTDQGHDAVDQLTPTCELLSKIELPGVTLGQLSVQEYSSLVEGDVYVAGENNGTIYQFGPGLTVQTELIKGLSEPTDVTIDEKGDIFVSELDSGDGKVLEYNAAGEPIDPEGKPDPDNTIIEGLTRPEGLAINQTGTELYVATGTVRANTLSRGKLIPRTAELIDQLFTRP